MRISGGSINGLVRGRSLGGSGGSGGVRNTFAGGLRGDFSRVDSVYCAVNGIGFALIDNRGYLKSVVWTKSIQVSKPTEN